MAAAQDESEESVTAGLNALSISTRRSFTEGGQAIVFEGMTSTHNKIKLLPYDGGRNPNHDNKTLASPCLLEKTLYNTREDCVDFDSFLKVLQRQGKCINDEYTDSMHGELRAIARYGNAYMYNMHLSTTMTVEEFDLDLNKGHRTASAGDVFSGFSADTRGSHRGSGRAQPSMSHSFIPSAARKDVLQKLLKTFNFEEVTCTEKYNVPCTSKQVNTIILDKDLNFLECRLPDVMWMALDLKRRPRSDAYPYGTDIRFKLQSRRILRGDEVEKSEAYKKFLDPDHKVLEQGHRYDLRHLHGEPSLQIHPDYRDKVHFARRKLIRRFRAADDVQHSRFRTEVEVRLTEVCEFSRPDDKGRFLRVIRRQEVTVIPPLPDWTRPEEVDAFAREYWQFCLELGDTLYP
ncbi:uncharacterized protein LOC144870863 [Branchiostoma floridae x Branchiostoma japonicum]